MNQTLRKKLIACWRKDYSDELTALKCGIELSELRILLKEDEKLAKDRKVALAYMRMQVKDNIADAIKKGKKTEWYAERRMGDEYSTKQNISLEASVDIPVAEKEEKVKEMFKQYE